MRSVWAFAVLLVMSLPGSALQAEELIGYTGVELYKRFCASCHGLEGRGDGPVAVTLKSMVPDLTTLARRRRGEFPAVQVRRIIDGQTVRPPHGSRDMPVWGWEFAAAQGADEAARQRSRELIERLVEYLRTIQRPS
jgi:mono/diheme cytochrome c family protein